MQKKISSMSHRYSREDWNIANARGQSPSKYCLIERLKERKSRDAIQLLPILMHDKNGMVRADATDCIGYYRGEVVVRSLIAQLRDGNELVRINAMESLKQINARKAARSVSRLLRDKYYLVRGYAGSILGDIGSRAFLGKLRSVYSAEKNEWVRLMLLKGLNGIGEKVTIWDYIRFWYSPNYHVRSMLVNTLADLAKGANKPIILSFLKYALSVEKTRAVSTTIRTCISDIRQGNSR